MARPQDEKLFTALGKITYAWSTIDTFLDYANFALHHEFGGKEIEPNLPHTSLEMKIEYFRRIVCESPALTDSKRTAGIDMAAKLATMADRRHWMIHGMSSENDGETVTFLRSRLRLKQHQTRKWSFAEMEEFYEQSVTLGFGLALFISFNLGIMPRDQHGKFLRALTEECRATIEFGEPPSES